MPATRNSTERLIILINSQYSFMSDTYDAPMERILPIDLLRTLLVLARTQSFSRTGEEIGRSQSAVSLQMRRLQQIVGAPILANSGKSFGLTPQGEIVLEYAKQIVALNDECVGRLDGGILTGTIRVGIPSDFALSFLPQLLGRFSEAHPDIALDVTCELSRDLIGGLARNEFDVVLAVHDDRSTVHLTDQWREPMAWVGSQAHDLRARRPLPLVLFPDGCQYRLRVLSALRRRDIPYRIVYSSSNLAGNQAAIESGLGLTAISQSTVPPTLRPLPPCAELPALDDFDIGLFWNPVGATGAIRALAAAIVEVLDRELTRTGGLGRLASTHGSSAPR
ncbi:MAG: LysR substrate-binding domain-containing protein [Rhodospirillales bacterium]|nr:LysR substrate-binding domain-containing protein [Rhodospirillales bacterium]